MSIKEISSLIRLRMEHKVNITQFTMEAAMTEAGEAVRGLDGRFLPGRSGNPAGKRPGTRNRATRLTELLEDGDAERLARILVDRALAGDAASARFCLGYLLAK